MMKTSKSTPRHELKLQKGLQQISKKRDRKMKTKKKKKQSNSKSKNSFRQQIIRSVSKKIENKKKIKKKINSNNSLGFNKLQIIQSKQFKQLCMLESQYKKSIRQSDNIKWIMPKQALKRQSRLNFSEFVRLKDFQDINNLMMNFLHFVCKRRVIKDQHFQNIYNQLQMKFPQYKNQIKKIMIQVLQVLDS